MGGSGKLLKEVWWGNVKEKNTTWKSRRRNNDNIKMYLKHLR